MQKIRQGQAVVVTAEEMVELSAEQGVKKGRYDGRRRDDGDIRTYVFLRRVYQFRPL